MDHHASSLIVDTHAKMTLRKFRLFVPFLLSDELSFLFKSPVCTFALYHLVNFYIYLHQGVLPHAAHMHPPFPMFPMGFPPVPPPGVPPPGAPPPAQQQGPNATPHQPSATQSVPPSSTAPQASSLLNPVSGIFSHHMHLKWI